MFRGICLALCALVLTSSSALASGGNGGTKKDATITVNNDISASSSSRIGVILDQTDAQLEAIANASNPEQAFTNAGGRFLQPGATTSFKVKAGSHVITVVGVSPTGESQGVLGQTTRGVGRNATLTVNASSL